MRIFSQNLTNYNIPLPENSIFRINLAWINTLNELEKPYSKQDIVKTRLDLLVLRGFLLERDGKYFCSTKGKILSNAGIFSQKLYGFLKKN